MSRPDNNINRVVERARKNGCEPLYWRAFDIRNNTYAYVDNDELPSFERENNVGLKWALTPVFDDTIVDYNGYLRGAAYQVSDFDESENV